MTSDMMTAEQWAKFYALEYGTGAKRFWLAMLVMLVIGVVVGLFVVPQGLVPGTRNLETDLMAANERITELEADLSTVEATAAQRQLFLEAIDEELANASATLDSELVLGRTTSAILYTVYAPELEQCSDFVVAEIDGNVRTGSITPPYPC
jgi:hypothetical protein